MEKMIERPTRVTVKDKDGNILLSDIINKDSKIVHDEEKGIVDLYNAKGDRIWHSIVPEDIKIEVSDVFADKEAEQ